VAGRARAFADAKIVTILKTQFVTVACDDWYQRRRQDAEGEFFRRMADQGPRKGAGGSTRQGVYCLTADGTFLAYRPGNVEPQYMQQTIDKGLAAWKKLPEERRRPGAIEVGDHGKTDPTYTRDPPEGGLVLRVFTRALDRTAAGYCDSQCDKARGGSSQRDHLWLKEAEWKSLIPARPVVGQRNVVPTAIARRIFRFHLVDGTRGEPNLWASSEVRRGELVAAVESVTAELVLLRLEGSALMATDVDEQKALRGYDVALSGLIRYDRQAQKIDRFDLVAVGDHWGEGRYTPGARPGRTPLGVAFDLAPADSTIDRVPPQGARELSAYYRAE
jgi:hypothetical protein